MPMTKPTSEQVTFLAAGAGASQRTALDKLRDVVSVDDFGAIGNTTTGLDGNDDTVAVQAALTAAVTSNGRGFVRFTAGKAYRITATLNVPASVTVDFSNAFIYAPTVTTLFSLGGSACLNGQLGFVQTSGNAGAAIKKATPGTGSANHITGLFVLSALNARVAGSIGIDVTGFINSTVSVDVRFFEKAFANDTSVTTATTYYNQFLNSRCLGCVRGIDLSGTATNIINGTDIHSFDFNGQANGVYGIRSDSGGTITIIGGYIEGMNPTDVNARGILALSTLGSAATTLSIIGTALDSSSSVSNYAIEFGANTIGCAVHGVRFGGGWSSSAKTILADATAPYIFTGAGTNTHARFGNTGAGTAGSVGEVLCNQLTATKVVQSAALAADNAATFNNTADGNGILITTASSTTTRPSIECARTAEGRVISTNVGGSVYPAIFVGTGSPETVYSAQPGSIFLRRDGGAGTCFYVKESGTGNTGWVAK